MPKLTLSALGIRLALVSCVAVFLGCASKPEQGPTKQVQVISEPAGARIEVNGDYIGRTPLTITVKCDDERRFTEDTRIKAYPVQPGQYEQSKFFSGGRILPRTASDAVPSRIFFDMNLAPEKPGINVDIHHD